MNSSHIEHHSTCIHTIGRSSRERRRRLGGAAVGCGEVERWALADGGISILMASDLEVEPVIASLEVVQSQGILAAIGWD